MPANMPRIPIFLLKTRSVPNDSYEEYFVKLDSPFVPSFVPVLEHQPNEENLLSIKTLLRDHKLQEQYGGVIFTSQRAVESFARVLSELEEEQQQQQDKSRNTPALPIAYTLEGDYPLYVVGPATARTLDTLLHSFPLLSSLKCKILGRESGSGENLARYMLKHYNHAHYRDYFEIYEAPRLPFVPLVGNRSEQYPRLEKGDHRLKKRPLLFLVGETRRDVIPRTLMDPALPESERIMVEEVEVYRTGVMASFEADFRQRIEECRRRQGTSDGSDAIVVVVFSPSGCEAMLRVLGLIDEQGAATHAARAPCVIVTIGPTTRDYLRETFAVEADVCARAPSPEGIAEGLQDFLQRREGLS